MAKKRPAQDNDMNDLEQDAQAPESALEEGKLFDYVTGNPVKDSDKERVRQRIARAIIHEYGIAAEDMEPDFKVKVLGKNRKLDIAIFKPGTEHTVDNLYRVVVVEKEPKLGTKGAYRMCVRSGHGSNCQRRRWVRSWASPPRPSTIGRPATRGLP